jgi:hypothetical protein
MEWRPTGGLNSKLQIHEQLTLAPEAQKITIGDIILTHETSAD